MIGDCSPIKELRDTVEHVAATDAVVMIIGETGTGKELVAQAIHNCSPRAADNFVPVDLSALPDNLVESVLLGHEKGAFTGAESRRAGLCHHADQDTLFLDEIGEMSRDLQPKLLRFLQTHAVQRVGSPQDELVGTRIVSATNRTVEELLQCGLLREDIFFRLHVIPIHVPALRDRKDDIPVLANALLTRTQTAARRHLSFSSACLDMFYSYSWPGNIRQLQNVVERMAVMARGDVIEATEFELERSSVVGAWQNGQTSNASGNMHSAERNKLGERLLTRMETAERRLIIDALQQTGGCVTEAAAFLGVGTATIYRKIRSLEIRKTVPR
jgi:DNA-binding NtrC family response regulator